MKMKVERQEGQVWRSVLVDVAVSRNSNFTFKRQVAKIIEIKREAR